ncbi:MAG: CHAT domain-containing protein [Myxococcaceae bacterium]|nr:CHAT domain-containing protein [Myxococcaceae bacterium]
MKPYTLTLEIARGEAASNPFEFLYKEQEYLLRQEDGYLSARLTWDSQCQEDLAELGKPSPNREAAQRLGDTLREFLEELGWGTHEARLQEAVREGREVHITFRLAAAELYSLPWELVTLKASGQHLGELPRCHVHYEWPGVPAPAEDAAAPAEGGRILFAWSAAGGDVPAEEHLNALREVCERNDYPFDPGRDVVGQVSLRKLREALAASEEPVAALHILCHGARSPYRGSGDFGLQWNASEGEGKAFVDPGDLRQALAPHAGKVRMVVLCACLSGNAVPDSHLGSVAQALHRVGIPAVVASRMPLTVRGSIQMTRILYEELLGKLSPLSRALSAVRGRLQEDAESLDWASLQMYARGGDELALRPFVFRPYRGLLAFGPKDRRFFFGRRKLEAELLERVGQAVRGEKSRFQVVLGASGVGKSSLVMAGLVPQLSRQEWDLVALRPGELVRSETCSGGERSVALKEVRRRVHQLWSTEPLPVSDGASMEDVVEEVRQLRQARPDRKLLLVLDQFEEVFTLLQKDERRALIRGGWALGKKPGLECVIVATLRVDYLERCGEILLDDGRRLDAVLYAERYRMFVAQPGLEELTEAIEQPARKVGLELKPGLVERLCRDVGQEPGALPLLEHALDLLWQRREGQWLTHRAYKEMDGLTGALIQTAEQLGDELSDAERAQARRLLVRLVAIRDMSGPRTQGRAWVEEMQPRDSEGSRAFQAVLEKLVRSRLLVTGGGEEREEGGRGVWVQLAHETLLRRWKRLERWVEEDWEREKQLRELERCAEDWEAHRGNEDEGASYLLTGYRLEYAQGLRGKYGSELSSRSQRLLDESLVAEERRQEKEKEVIRVLLDVDETLAQELRQIEQEQEVRQRETAEIRAISEARLREVRLFRRVFGVTAVLLLASVAALVVERL